MCEISCKNSERLIRKWQKNFRGYFFFAAHCTSNSIETRDVNETSKVRGRGQIPQGWGQGRGQRCRINYKLLIWIQLKKYCISSHDSVNAIALPYVWQLTDNYGYTEYSLLLADKYSVTDGCDSFMTRFWWFTTRPWGQPKWERSQHCTRPRMRPRPDTTRPRPKNLALRPCWPWSKHGMRDNCISVPHTKA